MVITFQFARPNSAFLQIVAAHMGLNSKHKDAVQESMKVIRDLVQHENTELLLFTDAHDETLLHQVSKASPTLDDLNYLKESHVMKAFKEDFRPLVIKLQIQVKEKNEEIKEAENKINSPSEGSMPFNLKSLFVAGRKHIRQFMPSEKRKKIFTVRNNTLKVLQIVPLKNYQFLGNNMLSVRDDNSEKGNFSTFAYIKIAPKKKCLLDFQRSKYFLIELLDMNGYVVDHDLCKVPLRGTQEINLLSNTSSLFRDKINQLVLHENYDKDDLLSSQALNMKELAEEYKDTNTEDTHNFLITGSIDSRNWGPVKANKFDSELHILFPVTRDQKIHFCYVFTSADDEFHKNFALAKLDGKQMKKEEIGEAASYIRRMYTGIYSNMEDLYADDNTTFLKKLRGNRDKMKGVYQAWRAREYKTNYWLYNDLHHGKFKELIFSTKRGSLLNGFFQCEFEEYKEASCVWPSASISEIDKSTLIIKEW